MGKLYINDIGTVLSVDADPGGLIGTSLIGYTLTLQLQAPSGAIYTKTAALQFGSTHVAEYTTIAGDISEAGTWKLQLVATFGTATLRGQTTNLVVYSTFN